jgi:hypothetical protein
MTTKAVPALWLALLLGACGGGTNGGKASVQATVHPAAVTMTVRGAATIDFKTTAPLQIVASVGEAIPVNLRFLSVAFSEPQTSAAGEFRAGANVFGFTGNGTFHIEPTKPGSPPQGLTTLAFFELTPKDATTPLRFQQAVLRCTITIARDGFEGSIDCPALREATGKSVSLKMSWKA